MKRLPNAARHSNRQLLLEKLDRTFPAEGAHGLVVAPFEVLFEFFVQLFYAAEMLPIVEISLIVAVTSLNFSVVPRCSRRY